MLRAQERATVWCCWCGTGDVAGRPAGIARLNFVEIKIDDLKGAEIRALLAEHLECMYRVSPPESVHALGVTALCQPEITFWSIWIGPALAGCGALKKLSEDHGEVKSMRTATALLEKGVASMLLHHLIDEAKARGYRRLSLETGSMDYFLPARNLYEKFGFTVCGPFGGYKADPNSTFMSLSLDAA